MNAYSHNIDWGYGIIMTVILLTLLMNTVLYLFGPEVTPNGGGPVREYSIGLSSESIRWPNESDIQGRGGQSLYKSDKLCRSRIRDASGQVRVYVGWCWRI